MEGGLIGENSLKTLQFTTDTPISMTEQISNTGTECKVSV